MFNGKKVIAVCIAKAFEANSFRYIRDLNEYAAEKDYKLFVYQTGTDLYMNDSNDCGEKYVFDLIDFDIADGIVIFTEMLKDRDLTRRIADEAIARNIPVVSVDAPMERCINIVYDYGDCFEKIVRHIIIDHKLTKVNFIAGFKGNDFSEERLNVYKKVLAEQGIPYDPERVGYGDFWEYPTRAVMEKFLAEGKELPEAIICSNDVMAMIACKCLREKGYSVPDDVLISGFDGIEDERFHSPRLTTSSNSNDKLSKCAVDLIDRAIKGENVPEKNIINFDVVISQSCGCKQQKADDAYNMISELHNRLVNYMLRSYNMTGLISTISSVKKPEQIVEQISGKEELKGTYCCLNADALNPKGGVMEVSKSKPFTDEMLMLYHGSYDCTDSSMIWFDRKNVVPKPESYMLWADVPMVFSVLHYLDVPLGYVCMAIPLEVLHFERIQQVAEAYSVGFGNVRMLNAMEYLTTHDPLTNLYNRRGFYQLIKPHFSKSAKKKRNNVTIVSADLDSLKYINDTFGHSEGDNAIKTVAAALEYASVNGEICARFGGDEFVVAGFANETDNYSENFRKLVYEYLDKYNSKSGKPYKVASSLGIICCTRQNSTIDELIKMSDDLMYDDKIKRKQVRQTDRNSD